MFETLLTVVHVLIAFTLVIVVLFQQGKGANIGATFGGSSQTMFGPRGPFQFLAKATTAIAVGFMLTSISLSVMSNNRRMDSVIPASAVAPAATDELPTTLPERAAPANDAAAPSTDGPVAEETTAETGGPVDGPVAAEPDAPAESGPGDAK